MTEAGEVAAWLARAPQVPSQWFRHDSRLHGVRHAQRVHIYAQRLTALLGWGEDDTRLVLRAALLHDIGRRHDGEDPRHGAASASRARRLGLVAGLTRSESCLVLFAVTYHSRPDRTAVSELDEWSARRSDGRDAGVPQDPCRALRILWLLKDADALDRVRLGRWEAADPRQLRHPETELLLPFADELYATLGP